MSKRSKLIGAGFRAFGPQAVPDGLLGILRHQFLQIGLGALVLDKGRPGPAEHGGKLRPGVGGTHIDDPDRLQPRPWRLDPEQPGLLAVHHAAPELLLRGQQQVLVQRIGMDGDLDPFAATGDDRQHRGPGIGDPHIVLQLRHVFFGGGFLRERPGQHELGLEHRATGINQAIQRRRHPFDDGMLDPPLHVLDGVAGVALIPAPVEVLGDRAQLDDQIVGEILRLDLAALLPPQPNEHRLVAAHDHPGVRAADEGAGRRVLAVSHLFASGILKHYVLLTDA